LNIKNNFTWENSLSTSAKREIRDIGKPRKLERCSEQLQIHVKALE
jgi:hypothetical protein